MANKKKWSQSLKTSTKNRSKVVDTTMCFPWIKVAWLPYIINVLSNYLSVNEVLEKKAFSVTDATQTRKRKRKAGYCHTCKKPMKGHSKIKDCPRNMAKQLWIRTVFYPHLQMFIRFSLKNLIWLYIFMLTALYCAGVYCFSLNFKVSKLYYFPGVA